jgi:D-3-phosphoglycerate dehydrogenase
MVTLRSSCGHSMAGTLAGLRREPRIVMIDEHNVEVPPSRHLLVVRNDDRPGMVGAVGTTLGAHAVNIADMAMGRAHGGGSALMAISTDTRVPDAVVAALSATPGITGVDRLEE